MMRRKLLLLIPILLLCLLGWQLFAISRFRVIKMVPESSGPVSTALKTFVIEFNRELDSSINYLEGIDDFAKIIEKAEVSGKTLTLYTKPLTAEINYKVTLKNIKAKDGSTIKTIEYDFLAKYIPSDNLSEDTQKQIAEQDNKILRDNPILAHLPYGGLHFQLRAEFEDELESGEPGKIFLLAELLLSASDVRTNRDQAIAKYKQEVVSYIESLGLVPDDYQIVYEIIEPSLY